MAGLVARALVRERNVRSSLCVRDSNREGVGVCWSSATGVEETSWSVPKERYLPSAGGGGGMRLRSSGGRERLSGIGAVVGWVAGEVDWPEDSRCACRLSRFCGVKDL